MSYKQRGHENPLGPDEPAIPFRLQHRHVLAILLAMAVLFTAWRYYQSQVLAPRTPIAWAPFTLEEVESVQQRGRGVLVFIDPDPAGAGHVNVIPLFEDGSFRKAVFLSRSVPLIARSTTLEHESIVRWLRERMSESTATGPEKATPETISVPMLLHVPRTGPPRFIRLDRTMPPEAAIQALFE